MLETVEVDFSLAKKDYSNAYSEYCWNVDPLYRMLYVYLLAIGYLLFSIYNADGRIIIPVVNSIIFIMFFFVIGLAYKQKQVGSLHKDNTHFFGPRKMQFTDDNVVCTNADGTVRMNWEYFSKWWQTRRFILLFDKRGTSWPIPKEALSPDDLEKLAALLNQKLVYKK